MANFEAQLSAQVPQGQKDEIKVVRTEDMQHGRVSEADIVRALIRLGLPLLRKKSPTDRLKLYALINRGE